MKYHGRAFFRTESIAWNLRRSLLAQGYWAFLEPVKGGYELFWS